MNEEKIPLFAYNPDTQKFWILGKIVDITSAEEVDKCIRAIKQENEQLKDLIVEKNNQIEDIRNQKKDYTEISILKMKLEASEKARKESIELLKKHLDAKSYSNHKYELFSRDYLEELLKILDIDKGE